MSGGWGCEMQRDFERGWAEFERRGKRRMRIRGALRLTLRYAGYAIGAAVMAILGGVFWICAAFPDYECERIFRAAGLLWAR